MVHSPAFRALRMHSARRRVGTLATIFAIAVVALLANVPATARASPTFRASSAQPEAGAAYVVTWNGVDVSTAGTPSSALSIDFSQTASLNFNWSTGASAPVNISDARLQMYYFGFAVSTKDQVVSNSVACSSKCHIPLDWTPLSINYVLEGVYRLTASFIAPNGTTMWSENFYVKGNAPLGFVALIPIVLLLIAIYEVYGLVRSGRYAALGRKPSAPTSGTPPQVPPEAPSAPAETPAPAAAPTPEETPAAPDEGLPPSGGSS